MVIRAVTALLQTASTDWMELEVELLIITVYVQPHFMSKDYLMILALALALA